MYRRLNGLYWNENPIRSASAIAEGGLMRRLFEASMGSGLGALIDFGAFPENARKDGNLFAEAVGALLLEVDDFVDPFKLFAGLPFIEVGRVIADPQIKIKDKGMEVLHLPIEDLVRVWEKPFAEVVR
jgi:phosphoribosylformylglycinamidine (FGAM) synthase-like enzyme